MSQSISALAVILLISLPGAAMADVYPSLPAPVPPGVTPQRLSPRQVFHWLDTNHDGFLTLSEFLAAPWVQNRQQATRFFRWMDVNKDGLVSLQEFLAAYTRYCGDNGNYLQATYPWAWTYWRPWQYGWYWHSGWHRRPGVWQGYAGDSHPYVARPRHAVNVTPVKHSHSVRHVKAVNHKPHSNHQGHVHQGHSHQSHAHQSHAHR